MEETYIVVFTMNGEPNRVTGISRTMLNSFLQALDSGSEWIKFGGEDTTSSDIPEDSVVRIRVASIDVFSYIKEEDE